MVAEIAIGAEKVRNDFDKVSIFNRPVFNATWDSNSRRWVDLVARGEPGFTFWPTENNREVVYRCSPFWYKIGFEGLHGPTYVSVSDQPLEGYRLAPMFKDGQTYEYRPCFELGLGNDGKAHSRAGLVPYEGTPAEVMRNARTFDAVAHTETIADWFSDYLLLLVEFGTRNLQGIMYGVAKGELFTTSVYDELNYEPGLYTDDDSLFEVGKSYRIVYIENGTRKILETELLDIRETDYDPPYMLCLDIDDIETFLAEHTEYYLYDAPAKTGDALRFVTNASSGKANEDFYSPFVWRGKENPWGNISSLICDVLFEAAGKTGVIYPYILNDIKKFDGAKNSYYEASSYTTKSLMKFSWGYITSFTLADNKEGFLIPSDFNVTYPHGYFATAAMIHPNDATKGARFLRVGGDYTLGMEVNHATYDMIEVSPRRLQFGGRLILEEGV